MPKRPASEWERVTRSKDVQALALKIEIISRMNDERASIIRGIVDTLASMTDVYNLFPTLENAFSSDGVFKVEYASRIRTNPSGIGGVCEVLTRCAWLVVKGASLYDLKREYCNLARRREVTDVLPYVEKPPRTKAMLHNLTLEDLEVKERPRRVTLSFVCWRRVIA